MTREDLAEVAVRHRYHATLNPASVMGRRSPLTVEVARQLRGECGKRQVPGARIGLSLGSGRLDTRLRRHPDHGRRLMA